MADGTGFVIEVGSSASVGVGTAVVGSGAGVDVATGMGSGVAIAEGVAVGIAEIVARRRASTVASIFGVGVRIVVGKAASTAAAIVASISGVVAGWAVWHPTMLTKIRSIVAANFMVKAPAALRGLGDSRL